MKTIRFKGGEARNYFAERLVEEYGEKALERCAKGSPMQLAVRQILDETKQGQSTPKGQE